MNINASTFFSVDNTRQTFLQGWWLLPAWSVLGSRFCYFTLWFCPHPGGGWDLCGPRVGWVWYPALRCLCHGQAPGSCPVSGVSPVSGAPAGLVCVLLFAWHQVDLLGSDLPHDLCLNVTLSQQCKMMKNNPPKFRCWSSLSALSLNPTCTYQNPTWNLSTYLSFHVFTCIYVSRYLFIHPSSIRPSTHSSIHSIYPSTTHYPSIHPSIHPSIVEFHIVCMVSLCLTSIC
jgi:hypothetical protein